jgi:hypothetical protein
MRAVWDDAGACSWIALALPDWTTPGASFLRRKGDSESSRNRLDMLSVICICVWTDKLLSLKDAPKFQVSGRKKQRAAETCNLAIKATKAHVAAEA